jgi:4-amino-4-deoxy-L-arabinose transferase-like glycosyltransferase
LRAPPATTGFRAFTTLGLVTGILLVVRLWLDGHLELMFDEAYYALWAKHLAWGYFDHPPMVALWIRLSNIIFGDREFGVRALGTLAATLGTGLVYLVTWRLFASRETALFAAFLYCAMLLISAGAIIITPDTPLIFFWSIALYALVRIFCKGGAGWWWLVGIAMGLALQSKYTALLLGAGIVCALAVVPRLRQWWQHPMPYVAGLLSLAIFAPVVVWNHQHGWASFGRQFGRAQIDGLSLRFVAELLGSQVGLLTPFVFVLAAIGVSLALRRHRDENNDANLFLVSLIGPTMLYFLFHSLHARVQGNWVGPVYPVLAALGAQAAYQRIELPSRLQRTIALSRRLAVPVGLVLTAIAYLQAAAAPIPFAPAKDPTALMAGWRHLTEEVDAVADDQDAQYILTSHYVLSSELGFYSRGDRPIVQYNERIRWLSFGTPLPSLFEGRGLYVAQSDRDSALEIAPRFSEFRKIAEVARTRGGQLITSYVIYLVAKPRRPVLD